MTVHFQPEPEDYARDLLSFLKCEKVEDICAFAINLGLQVREVDATSFDGALVRLPRQLKGRIAVRQTIRESGRKAFTVAHEIGHFILPGHGITECYCTKDDINSWRGHVLRSQENAANKFASELLLPTLLTYEIVKKSKASITTAKQVSAQFNTSLTAAAIKCVEVTEEACAVIWSKGRVIRWSWKSPTFRPYVNRGPLLRDSIARKLSEEKFEREAEGEVPAHAWLSTGGSTGLLVWEDSIYMPYYDGTLTILTLG